MSTDQSDDFTLVCSNHGRNPGTVICEHLFENKGFGFNTPDEESGRDPYPEAWCNECEQTLTSEDGWTEAALDQARFQAICCKCYAGIRDRYLKVLAYNRRLRAARECELRPFQ